MIRARCSSTDPGEDLREIDTIGCIPCPQLAILIPAASPQCTVVLQGHCMTRDCRNSTNPREDLSEVETHRRIASPQLAGHIMTTRP